jgi:phosphatidylserine decarboxylase
MGRRIVPSFIKKYGITISEFSPGTLKKKKSAITDIVDSYPSFNQFFIREFKKGKRSWPVDQNLMGAFAEGRYFGTEEIHDSLRFPVKGHHLRPLDLLGDEHEWTELFDRGPMLIARLCPTDYHRYHYPDDGKTLVSYSKSGPLHSVSPRALQTYPATFIKNERRISILETKNFGKLAYIEVGALMVGKIIQSHDEQQPFNLGAEKGYFMFGGSTVILLGQYKAWQPSEDILDHSYNGIETFVKLGDAVGIR